MPPKRAAVSKLHGFGTQKIERRLRKHVSQLCFVSARTKQDVNRVTNSDKTQNGGLTLNFGCQY
jgi:hypothetical protein